MSKAKNKTVANNNSVADYINTVVSPDRLNDIKVVMKIMSEITGEKPVMWGTSIVGYGSYHYKYESGREGDFMKSGFASRKAAISIYLLAGFDRFPELMNALGKYKTGKSCLYIKKLADVDLDVLKSLIAHSHQYMTEQYG